MHTLRALLVTVALSLPSLALAQDVKLKEPPEIVRLKVENNTLAAEVVQLRLTVARLSAELEAQQVARERAAIEILAGKEAPAYEIDWKTGQLTPKSSVAPGKTKP